MKDYTDPRMHTAEHLLNASVARLLGCGRAFSSHIEKKKSKCDYRFPRDLTPEERAELERLVNGAIKADLPVSESFVPRSEAAGRFDLGRLPAGAGGDTLRVVLVGDYDACPCIGAHAPSTGGLGIFRIVSTGFAEGVLRIRFKLDAPAAGT
ncbi:MAG: alanyl-tRNA editing protein [Elusimicrobiales bacterium]